MEEGFKKEMNLTLSDLFDFSGENLDDWCICLNNQDGRTYSIKKNEAERSDLLRHMGYKKGHDRSKSFRTIEKNCLQFVRLDRDKKYDQWLFVGAFEQVGTYVHQYSSGDSADIYKLKKLNIFSKFDERLIVRYKKHSGDKQAKIKIDNINTMDVVKLLDGFYEDEMKIFEGYSNINLSFKELKKIVDSAAEEWRKPLSRVNGIYVITDTCKKKFYIGSTYGEEGMWQRWNAYANTNGTGGNIELRKLIDVDQQYAFDNFVFTAIECHIKNNGDKNYILERESYWKNVFLTRDTDLGYNRN